MLDTKHATVTVGTENICSELHLESLSVAETERKAES